MWEKLLPSNAKRPLLVDVRRSKTSLLKFPINPLSPKSDQHQITDMITQDELDEFA